MSKLPKRYDFATIGGLKPAKTMFNLSHSNLTTLDFGELVPVSLIECVPGDYFDLDVSCVGRLASALNSPILSQIDVVYEAFFCPSRILMGHDANFDTPIGEDTFENFIKGGKDGKTPVPLPKLVMATTGTGQYMPYDFQTDGLGDCFGLQIGAGYNSRSIDGLLSFPWRMYRLIWNEFYRNQFLMNEIQVPQFIGNGSPDDETFISINEYDSLLRRCWGKDYFTASLPFQQFGVSPAFPISGQIIGDVTAENPDLMQNNIIFGNVKLGAPASNSWNDIWVTRLPDVDASVKFLEAKGDVDSNELFDQLSFNRVQGLKASMDLSNAVTFDVNDLRLNVQIQKWMERNARSGVRYTEYLQSHFGVHPTDARLQRPEFIGATRCPWIVSEVLQTSETTGSNQSDIKPQGNQAGQMVALGRGKLGKFRCYEFGYIMILASVLPKASYQTGTPKLFTRETNLDFYSPEFAHLSEQAVLTREIYETGNKTTNDKIFGFQGIWNELRYLPDRVTRHMRTKAEDYSYDYWHLARYFKVAPELDTNFLLIGQNGLNEELHRVFAVQDIAPFILSTGIKCYSSRPLPYSPEPGYMDHF